MNRRGSRSAEAGPSPVAALFKPVLLALVAVSLLAAVFGGLWRAGVTWPAPSPAIGHAVVHHAALMISAFFGTVIATERAVALKSRAAFLAPSAAAIGGALLVLGQAGVASAFGVVAATLFVLANVVIVRRQPAAHTRLLLVAALAWLAGNVLFALQGPGDTVIAAWFAFLVLTIGAERLEMTRVMRRRPAAEPALLAIVAALLAGAALTLLHPVAGALLYGTALMTLAGWLGLFDIARRTVLAHGLSRYMAVCLLAGYVWLAVAGGAWVATALGLPLRDLAIHALGMGFVFGMAMGHAPVMVPALARVKLLFSAWLYAPVALLNVSLAVRAVAALAHDPQLLSTAAALNAASLALFAFTIAASAVAWRFGGAPNAGRKLTT